MPYGIPRPTLLKKIAVDLLLYKTNIKIKIHPHNKTPLFRMILNNLYIWSIINSKI